MTSIVPITSSQAQKEVTANEAFIALGPAGLFGRKYSTTSGLTWGYYGGILLVDGVLTSIADGTVALTASTTNYVEATRAGVVSKTTSGFSSGQIPLYTVVTGASSVSSYTDYRLTNFPLTGRLSKSVAGGTDVTLTAAEARNQILEFTGALTANINLIVPAVAWEWVVFNNTTGSFSLTVKPSAGTGIAVPQGRRAMLYGDGTNVVEVVGSSGVVPVPDTTALVQGSTDSTKQLRFEVDGFTTATTRIITPPDRNLILESDLPGALRVTGRNNATTPNTQFDLSADALRLRSSGGDCVIQWDPATITCNISTAGPAANGRDQSGAFAANSWVHLYWIWNGTTLATISSATAPPTGPTLPTGYTHWAYAGAIGIDSSGNLMWVRIRDAWVYYESLQTLLNGGSATTETAVSVSSLVPSNALAYLLDSRRADITTDASGNLDVLIQLRTVSGSNYNSQRFTLSGLSASTIQKFIGKSLLMPNFSGLQFYYLWTVTLGSSPSLFLDILGYQIPNGS